VSGVPAWAVRGAKVVCVAESWGGPENHPDVAPPSFAPAKGAELTIAGIDQGAFLFFAELPEVYETPLGIGQVSWPVDAFRPLVTHEQDMAIFRPILDQVPVDA
jgi:hypothetical protein